MAERRLKNTERVRPERQGWRKKKERSEDELLMFKLKELLIERRAPLMLSRRKYLNFKYCEIVTMFNGTATRKFVVPEFEHPEKIKAFPTNFEKIYTFGIHELRNQIGMKFTCVNVVRTEGRVQLHLCLNPSPATRRRQEALESVDVFSQSDTDGDRDTQREEGRKVQSDDGYATQPQTEAPSSVCSDNEQAERIEPKTPSTGSVVIREFNGSLVKDFHIVKSSSSQTDDQQRVEDDKAVVAVQPTSRAVEKEPLKTSEVSGHLHRSMQIARLREKEHFMRARSYLAFYSKFSQFGYKGETKLSVGNQLHLVGLPIEPGPLREIYNEALKDLFSKEEIDHDLDCCYAMIQTERTMYLERASDSVKKRYGGTSGDSVPVAHHGYANRPGRCDPDICILM